MLVLGGHGFIGRHAVQSLLNQGASVTIGTRSANEQAALPERKFVLHQSTATDDWLDAAEEFDVILNCVGILRQRPFETYDAVHHQAPLAIATACARTNTRFVHVSALGLSADAKSRFLTSKLIGEHAIERAGGDWAIARLSLLDGEGGFGASWLRGVSRLPACIVPTSATGLIAALTATDAGDALSALCHIDHLPNDARTFELGGHHHYTFEQYIRGLRKRHTEQEAVAIQIPGWLARLGAHLCDGLHFSPFSFGHWELLCGDNLPRENRLAELLGRAPTPVIQPD